MGIVDNLSGQLGSFFEDCGITLEGNEIAANRLYKNTAALHGNYANARKQWDSNAKLIAEIIGVATDLNATDGIRRLKTMSLSSFKSKIAGNTKAFIDFIRPGAEEAERIYKIPAAITIAQGILETGSGKSTIGYNLFGIKAGSEWKGRVVSNVKTKEDFGSGLETKYDAFRDYGSFYEAIVDHARVLMKPNYAKARAQFAQDKSPKNFGHNITGIYATDKQYGNKLAKIMDDYGLA